MNIHEGAWPLVDWSHKGQKGQKSEVTRVRKGQHHPLGSSSSGGWALQANLYHWQNWESLQLTYYLCYCYFSCLIRVISAFFFSLKTVNYWDLFKGKHCGQAYITKWFRPKNGISSVKKVQPGSLSLGIPYPICLHVHSDTLMGLFSRPCVSGRDWSLSFTGSVGEEKYLFPLLF